MTTIYTLSCPISNSVMYVGATTQDLKKRLTGHLSANDSSKRANWIIELKTKGLKPIIEPIEYVNDNGCISVEEYWINQFRVWGFNLYNSKSNIVLRTTLVRTKHKPNILSAKTRMQLKTYIKSRGVGSKGKLAELLCINKSQVSLLLSGGIIPSNKYDALKEILSDKPVLGNIDDDGN